MTPPWACRPLRSTTWHRPMTRRSRHRRTVVPARSCGSASTPRRRVQPLLKIGSAPVKTPCISLFAVPTWLRRTPLLRCCGSPRRKRSRWLAQRSNFAACRWTTRRRARRRAVRRDMVELRRDELRAASSTASSPISLAAAPARRWRGRDRTARSVGVVSFLAQGPEELSTVISAAAPLGEALASSIRRPPSSRAAPPLLCACARKPLGFILPPSYASGSLERPPRLLAALTPVERAAQRCRPLAAFADHYILEARRRPARDA